MYLNCFLIRFHCTMNTNLLVFSFFLLLGKKKKGSLHYWGIVTGLRLLPSSMGPSRGRPGIFFFLWWVIGSSGIFMLSDEWLPLQLQHVGWFVSLLRQFFMLFCASDSPCFPATVQSSVFKLLTMKTLSV